MFQLSGFYCKKTWGLSFRVGVYASDSFYVGGERRANMSLR